MPEAPINLWLAGPLPAGVEEVLSRLCRTEGVTHIAVMPDVHLASEFCVGTVIASDRFLFPNAVGGDIGCGMLALQFDGDAEPLADPDRAAQILGQFQLSCPARRHHRKTANSPSAHLLDQSFSHPHLESQLRSQESRLQLGTLGAGNHFLELQRDESTGQLWLMLHTGSRHLGQSILHHHLSRSRKFDTRILALAIDSPEGRAYAADVATARAWARENRRLLALRAAAIIEQVLHIPPLLESLYDCDHNHVQLETHAGRQLWIHRKGATAAAPNQAGLIPGSMATRSFHTKGRGHPDSLASSSHGAGRALSRTQARQSISRASLRQQLRHVWYDARLEPHLREEAPSAYKPIDRIMQAQATLTTITRHLKPLLIHKGI